MSFGLWETSYQQRLGCVSLRIREGAWQVDAETEREVGDWWGRKVILHGNRPESLRRRRQGGITPMDRDSRRDRPIAVESGGLPGYDRGLRFRIWEISA